MEQHNESEGIVQFLNWLCRRWRWTIPAVVVLVWFLWGVFVYYNRANFSPKDVGQLGDTFGVVNSLFSGLAMLGVAYTVWLQHSELSLLKQKMEDEKRDSLTRAQPRIEFKSVEKPIGTEDSISARVPVLSLRSLITEVRFECDTAGCEMRCGDSTAILPQDNWSDSIIVQLRKPEIEEFNNSKEYARVFRMFYRDGRGERQCRKLLLTCTDTLVVNLAPSSSWDHSEPIA